MTIPLGVVLVSYHDVPLVDRALADLPQDAQVVIIDNGGEPSLDDFASAGRISILRPGTNIGFASAVNLGLRALDRDGRSEILLLNPDALVSAATLAGLQARLRNGRDNRVAAVAPQLFFENGDPQRTKWPLPSLLEAALYAVGLTSLLRSTDGFLIGACLLISVDALHEVGDFDERFFLYFEEADWQKRARLAGWSSLLAEDLSAEHIGGASSTDSGIRTARFVVAREQYMRKWYGSTGWWLHRVLMCIGIALRVVAGRGNAVELRRELRSYLDGPVRVLSRAAQAA